MCIHGIYNSCYMHEYQYNSFLLIWRCFTFVAWIIFLHAACYINHSFQTTSWNSNEGRPSSTGPQCLNGPPRIWVPCGWRSALVLLSWKRLLINNSWLDHQKQNSQTRKHHKNNGTQGESGEELKWMYTHYHEPKHMRLSFNLDLDRLGAKRVCVGIDVPPAILSIFLVMFNRFMHHINFAFLPTPTCPIWPVQMYAL